MAFDELSSAAIFIPNNISEGDVIWRGSFAENYTICSCAAYTNEFGCRQREGEIRFLVNIDGSMRRFEFSYQAGDYYESNGTSSEPYTITMNPICVSRQAHEDVVVFVEQVESSYATLGFE